MRHIIILYIAVLCCLTLGSCAPGSRPSDEVSLCILYTTDTHSAVYPYDFNSDRSDKPSLSNFMTLVKAQRLLYGDRCLVFDNGNSMSGSIPSFYYNYIDTLSQPICFRAQRALEYDAVGIGSDENDLREYVNQKRHDRMNQPPLVCANFVNRQTGTPIGFPYITFERKGIRIAVIGMTAPSTGNWMAKDIWNKVETEDMIECAQKWIPRIKEKAKPDLIIGLFCSNISYDDPKNDLNIDSYKNPAGGLPAAIKVPGFDIVLLGNSSEARVGKVRNEEGGTVTWLQAGSNCENAGIVRIRMKRKSNGNYDKHIFAQLADLTQYEPDPLFMHDMQESNDSIYLWYNRPIGYLGEYLLGYKGLYGPDYYRDIINQAIIQWAKEETHQDYVSIATASAPLDSFPAGPISMRQIFKIYPHIRELQTLSMSGEELRRFLEWGYENQFNTMRTSSDPLLRLVKDPEGHVVYNYEGQPTLFSNPSNYIAAGGINYTVDITKPAGQRVEINTWTDGRPFDPRGRYNVIINEEIVRDAGRFISQGLHWDAEDLSLHAVPTSRVPVGKILMDYFSSIDTVQLYHKHGWQVIPKEVWKPAKAREQATLDPIWR